MEKKNLIYTLLFQLLEWEVAWAKSCLMFPSACSTPAVQIYGEPLSWLPLTKLCMTDAPVGIYSAATLHSDWIWECAKYYTGSWMLQDPVWTDKIMLDVLLFYELVGDVCL